MKKFIFSLLGIALCQFAFAQVQTQETETSISTTTETSIMADRPYYIGASGGYIFKNKSDFDKAIWKLDKGYFAELNFGTKGNLFGWNTSLGGLKIDRQKLGADLLELSPHIVYEATDPEFRPESIVGANLHTAFQMNEVQIDSMASKSLEALYVMTGPSIWIGNDKIKFNAAIEGGVAYGRPGYYYIKGSAMSSNPLVLDVVPQNAGPGEYAMQVHNVEFEQFGMSQKYFDKLAAGTPGTYVKQGNEIMPLVRATGNIECFVNPRFSIHGGANYWYLFSPKMKGGHQINGLLTYEDMKLEEIVAESVFHIEEDYPKNDLKFFSANLGIKYWFGESKRVEKTTVITKEKNTLEQIENKPKEIIVTVVDKLTKTPMGGVEVELKGLDNQGDYKGITKDNGVLEFIDIVPGNYELNGQIYEINTTDDKIDKAEFAAATSSLYKTLYYDDPRFILKGVTINTSTNEIEEGVRVSLESGVKKISEAASDVEGNFNFLLGTNTDYQVQGLKNGMYSNVEEVTTKGLTRSQTLYVQLKIGMELAEVGKSFVIKNILYDFDDAKIRPDAAIELDRVVAFLETNPNLRIELSSHTDSRGNNTYNLNLSQRRAQSAVDYIVTRGISRHRLVAKGYGETKLVNGCSDGVECTEDQHQENRRTEIKIIE